MIFNICCLDTMSLFGDNSVNCVITSPPYNMNLRIRNGVYCSRQIVPEFSTKYVDFADNMPVEQFYDFHKKVLHEILRISPLVFYNISIVTGSKAAFFKLIGDFAHKLKDIIIWDKGHGQPAMQAGVLNRQSELLLVFSDDAISRQFKIHNFERGTVSDVWAIPRSRKIDKSHGAVFPEALVEKIIRNFTREGDVVYDPFMGTGTTLVVAKRLNRAYFGSEISKHYCEIASQRLDS